MENKKNIKTSTEKLPVTTKKQKFVGFKELMDTETGEVIPVQLNEIADRDFNFHKLWLQMFINGLDEIANKKMKLAFWIIDHLNKENQLIYTFRRMAEETGLSIETVIKTMKALQNGNPPFLKKMQSGVYVVNPDILYKGSHQSRMGVIYQFRETPTPAEKKEIEKFRTENTAPNSPESTTSHEETPIQEKVPAEAETPKNEPVGENFEILLKTDLPQLIGTEKQIWWAEQIRLNFFNELNFENMTKKLVEIFKTKTESKFWIENREKEIDELEKTL